MQKKLLIFFLSALTVLVVSCKIGEDVEPEYDEGPFNYGAISSIQCNGSIVINLRQGLSNRIVRKTKGGPQITNYGGYMSMNGSGTVDIEVRDPLGVSFNGGGIQCKDSVHIKQLSISGQSYDVRLNNLTVDNILTVGVLNDGDVVISGKTPYLIVSTTALGRFFGFDLIADSCYVSHSGLSDIQVNVKQKLTGGIMNLGDLFYKGNPTLFNVSISGTGKAYPK
jgi:hypothetical protein